jgi:uncharacterized protein (TIGR00288 family)
METKFNIAMLIDADNSPAGMIDEVLAELAKYGVINIRRAYGNWKSPQLKSWEAVLHEHAIQPVQQFAYSKGKNATDMAMSIDAMDLIYTKRIDGVCLVSSDADFTPLVMRIRADGLTVYGFGEKKTPEPFVNACSTFLYLENLAQPVALPAETGKATPTTRKAQVQRQSTKELKGNTRLVKLLRDSVAASADDDGWALLGAIGTHIGKQSSFDPRNHGYAKLSSLLQAIDLFDIEVRGKNHYVRDKRFVAATESPN